MTLPDLSSQTTSTSREAKAAALFATRTRLWAEQAPEAVAALRKRVAEERAGQFVLPGSEGRPVFVGSPPRWQENASPIGDREAIWFLNRHYQWTRFLRIAVLDNDTELRQQVLAEWLDWIATCPVPDWEDSEKSIRAAFDSPTPWRTLELGIRMEQTWPVAWESVAETLNSADRERILASFREHGRALAVIPSKLWPKADHNHYLTECAGLLQLALTFPEFPESTAWRDQAWSELGRCLSAQFTEDGGQVEGCPHYHAVSLRTLAMAVLEGRKQGLTLPESWRPRLIGALAYSLQSMRPTGVNVPWGDSDATAFGPVFAALLTALALDRTDELPALRTLVAPDAWKAAVAETLWYAPDPEAWLARLDALPNEVAPPLVNHQRGLGQVMFRTGWTSDAASVFFACQTPINNGHAHIDPAGFDYTALGRTFAVDPGRYTYHEGPDRYAFKSAAYHNTVTIDDRDPFAYRSTFDFEPQRPGHITAIGSGPGWWAAASEQHNFDPVVHRRIIILVEKSGALLVVDTFSGLTPKQTVQLWFHLDSVQVQIDGSSVETRDPNLANLRLTADSRLKPTPLPGRVSEVTDRAHPSTRIRFSDQGGAAERTYVTQLIPRTASAIDWPELDMKLETGPDVYPKIFLNGAKIEAGRGSFPFLEP